MLTRRTTIKLSNKLKRITALQALHCLCFVAVGTIVCGVYSFSNVAQAAAKVQVPKIPVVVAAVLNKDMPIYIQALGSVTPISNILIKTQINGQLLNTYFTEGQIVTANSKIALIDPRPYEAQLMQYKGQLMRDKALLANAQIDLERYQLLYSQDSIAKQSVDTQAALVTQYEGDIKTDQGLIDQAVLNINYCNIVAPIDGRLGFLQVDPGNFVQTSDTTGIVSINSISPIYVVFAITEDDLPRVARKVATGKPVIVEAQDRSQKEVLDIGTLYTIDNQIDPTTGTIKIKATFDNKTNMLFANQFVNARLQVDILHGAMTVPTTAIQYGTHGTFVFVVDKSQNVNLKYVTIAGSNENETAIVGELVADDLVVIEGADKLKEGTSVAIVQDNNQAGNVASESV